MGSFDLSIAQKVAVAVALPVASFLLYFLLKKSNEEEEEISRRIVTSRQTVIEVKVPCSAAGSIIGPRGARIKELQDVTGARIQFKDHQGDNEGEERTIVIRGKAEAAQQAEMTIRRMVAEVPPIITDTINVPERAIGRIIGRGGENIRSLCRSSKCRINVPQEQRLGGVQRITLEGTPQAVATAKGLIEENVKEEEAFRARMAVNASNRQERGPRRKDVNHGSGSAVTSTEKPGESTVTDVERAGATKEAGDAVAITPATNGTSDCRISTEYKEHKDYFKVFISAVEHPGHFWFQVVSLKATKLDDLMSDMTRYYSLEKDNKEILVDGVQEKDLLAAPFVHDDQWYRVEVHEIQDDNVDVYYVDFGDSEWVSKTQLRKLRSDFLTLPFHAVEACLANVKPKGEEWTEDAITLFEDVTYMAKWKVLEARTVSYTRAEDGTSMPCLELIDTSNPKDVNIAKVLIEKGFAEYSREGNNMAAAAVITNNAPLINPNSSYDEFMGRSFRDKDFVITEIQPTFSYDILKRAENLSAGQCRPFSVGVDPFDFHKERSLADQEVFYDAKEDQSPCRSVMDTELMISDQDVNNFGASHEDMDFNVSETCLATDFGVVNLDIPTGEKVRISQTEGIECQRDEEMSEKTAASQSKLQPAIRPHFLNIGFQEQTIYTTQDFVGILGKSCDDVQSQNIGVDNTEGIDITPLSLDKGEILQNLSSSTLLSLDDNQLSHENSLLECSDSVSNPSLNVVNCKKSDTHLKGYDETFYESEPCVNEISDTTKGVLRSNVIPVEEASRIALLLGSEIQTDAEGPLEIPPTPMEGAVLLDNSSSTVENIETTEAIILVDRKVQTHVEQPTKNAPLPLEGELLKSTGKAAQEEFKTCEAFTSEVQTSIKEHIKIAPLPMEVELSLMNSARQANSVIDVMSPTMLVVQQADDVEPSESDLTDFPIVNAASESDVSIEKTVDVEDIAISLEGNGGKQALDVTETSLVLDCATQCTVSVRDTVDLSDEISLAHVQTFEKQVETLQSELNTSIDQDRFASMEPTEPLKVGVNLMDTGAAIEIDGNLFNGNELKKQKNVAGLKGVEFPNWAQPADTRQKPLGYTKESPVSLKVQSQVDPTFEIRPTTIAVSESPKKEMETKRIEPNKLMKEPKMNTLFSSLEESELVKPQETRKEQNTELEGVKFPCEKQTADTIEKSLTFDQMTECPAYRFNGTIETAAIQAETCKIQSDIKLASTYQLNEFEEQEQMEIISRQASEPLKSHEKNMATGKEVHNQAGIPDDISLTISAMPEMHDTQTETKDAETLEHHKFTKQKQVEIDNLEANEPQKQGETQVEREELTPVETHPLTQSAGEAQLEHSAMMEHGQTVAVDVFEIDKVSSNTHKGNGMDILTPLAVEILDNAEISAASNFDQSSFESMESMSVEQIRVSEIGVSVECPFSPDSGIGSNISPQECFADIGAEAADDRMGPVLSHDFTTEAAIIVTPLTARAIMTEFILPPGKDRETANVALSESSIITESAAVMNINIRGICDSDQNYPVGYGLPQKDQIDSACNSVITNSIEIDCDAFTSKAVALEDGGSDVTTSISLSIAPCSDNNSRDEGDKTQYDVSELVEFRTLTAHSPAEVTLPVNELINTSENEVGAEIIIETEIHSSAMVELQEELQSRNPAKISETVVGTSNVIDNKQEGITIDLENSRVQSLSKESSMHCVNGGEIELTDGDHLALVGEPVHCENKTSKTIRQILDISDHSATDIAKPEEETINNQTLSIAKEDYSHKDCEGEQNTKFVLGGKSEQWIESSLLIFGEAKPQSEAPAQQCIESESLEDSTSEKTVVSLTCIQNSERVCKPKTDQRIVCSQEKVSVEFPEVDGSSRIETSERGLLQEGSSASQGVKSGPIAGNIDETVTSESGHYKMEISTHGAAPETKVLKPVPIGSEPSLDAPFKSEQNESLKDTRDDKAIDVDFGTIPQVETKSITAACLKPPAHLDLEDISDTSTGSYDRGLHLPMDEYKHDAIKEWLQVQSSSTAQVTSMSMSMCSESSNTSSSCRELIHACEGEECLEINVSCFTDASIEEIPEPGEKGRFVPGVHSEPDDNTVDESDATCFWDGVYSTELSHPMLAAKSSDKRYSGFVTATSTDFISEIAPVGPSLPLRRCRSMGDIETTTFKHVAYSVSDSWSEDGYSCAVKQYGYSDSYEDEENYEDYESSSVDSLEEDLESTTNFRLQPRAYTSTDSICSSTGATRHCSLYEEYQEMMERFYAHQARMASIDTTTTAATSASYVSAIEELSPDPGDGQLSPVEDISSDSPQDHGLSADSLENLRSLSECGAACNIMQADANYNPAKLNISLDSLNDAGELTAALDSELFETSSSYTDDSLEYYTDEGGPRVIYGTELEQTLNKVDHSEEVRLSGPIPPLSTCSHSPPVAIP